MTIKQINTILPSPLVITLDEISEKTLAIDTSIFLYKYKYKKPDNQEFITGFKMLLKQFKKNNIKPIFVFDGKPPDLKMRVLQARQKRKDEDSTAIRITKEDIDALKEYFDKEKVEYILAPGEAEKECCRLEKNNLADYVLSNDFDTFLFGVEKLIRCNKNVYELFTWETISTALELTREEFQMMAIAIGFDYLPSGIPGYGPKKSLEYIKKHKCLPKHTISQELLDEIYLEFQVN